MYSRNTYIRLFREYRTGILTVRPIFSLFSAISASIQSKNPIPEKNLPINIPGAWYTISIRCSPLGICAPRNAVFTGSVFMRLPFMRISNPRSNGMEVIKYPLCCTFIVPQIRFPLVRDQSGTNADWYKESSASIAASSK